MKCQRPSDKLCFGRFGRRSRHLQSGPIKIYEIRFLRMVREIPERFCERLTQRLLSLNSMSCSDQQKSIQGLNMLRNGNRVQFTSCYLGMPDGSRKLSTQRKFSVVGCQCTGVLINAADHQVLLALVCLGPEGMPTGGRASGRSRCELTTDN